MSQGPVEPPAVPLETHPPDETPTGASFPIVGVGASAGGLESFTEVLKGLPPDPGLAILYVAHLEAHHQSRLPEIYSHVTSMPVCEVREGMPIEVNHLYLIPPNTNMALTDGKLSLTPRSPIPGQHMPIDHLFRSLAAIQKNRAIGVLLSGGGTDGTLGFQAIKSQGGITIAQDEKTAAHPSMPRSAVLDGSVDFVLSPQAIAEQLTRLAQHPYAKTGGPRKPSGDEGLDEIVALLRTATDVDFARYKQSTFQRRLYRRLALLDCGSLGEYLQLLRHDREELNRLYQDLLIRVTQFFRDPDAYEVLKTKVFPALTSGRNRNRPLRLWVAGCSTGEEVYSLAIALLEYLETLPERLPIKILATDVNEAALEKARSGVYIDNIEIDVSPERLRRYFNRIDNSYQITKSIREMCVFLRHNLASDPPFSHLDLVSCRNVLIYMDASLQKRVVPMLHYALNPEAFLFLGSSESISPFNDLFTVVDGRHRIFARRPAPTGAVLLDFSSFSPTESRFHRIGRTGEGIGWTALDVQREADRLVLARYAPVGAVIDETMTVLQFRGRTAPYLEPAPGLASLDLFRMLREGLLSEVRAAVNEARVEDAAITREAHRLTERATRQPVQVEVLPFRVRPSGTRFYLVLFKDITQAGEAAPARPAAGGEPTAEAQTAQLQQELTAVREYLQSVIEEQESTNEELKSANEEVLSANEELQSTNEELQTAKEESQSANEELSTLNEELRSRNAELGRVNNDLLNLLSGVGIPIVMVSRDLRIRRFTPPAEKLFRLIPTDVGRPLSDIRLNVDIPDLIPIVANVIDSLVPHESIVKDGDGNTYFFRVRPYITLEKSIDGASLVVFELSSLQGLAENLKPEGSRAARTTKPSEPET